MNYLRIILFSVLFLLASFGVLAEGSLAEPHRKLYVAPYAHLDSQWRWTFRDTINSYLPDTLSKNAKLFEQFPDYVFNFTGAARYQWIREYYPVDYARLKNWVAEGRWHPAGSTVDEHDAIIPSSESILRQILYGSLYFEREFGTRSNDVMLPDTFGFPGTLPSLIAHSGIDGFSTQKLMRWNSAVGVPFEIGSWVGSDGQGVTACFRPEIYNRSYVPVFSHKSRHWKKRIDQIEETTGVASAFRYIGVGDRGGAPLWLDVLKMMNSARKQGPIRVQVGKSDAIFSDFDEKARKKMQSYSGDLLLVEHSAGILTSVAPIKNANRRNERLGSWAERASVGAHAQSGMPYPFQTIGKGWFKVLTNQMHDILTGTSIPEAIRLSLQDGELATQLFEGVIKSRVRDWSDSLVRRGQVEFAGELKVKRSVWLNPLPVERSEVVSIPGTNEFGMIRVPAMGLVVAEPQRMTGDVRINRNCLESSHLRACISDEGEMVWLGEVTQNINRLAKPTRLELQKENPKKFPSWNMDWDDRTKPPLAINWRACRFQKIAESSLESSMRVKCQSDSIDLIRTYRLRWGEPFVRVEFDLDWRGKASSLKWAFPIATQSETVTTNWENGKVNRLVNHSRQYEFPTHQFWDQSSAEKGGLAFFTGAKYGLDKPDRETVRQTLLYTPSVRLGSPFSWQRKQDLGRHRFEMAVYPHAGSWKQAKVDQIADRFEHPLWSQSIDLPNGPEVTDSLVRVSDGDAAFFALKAKEGDSSLWVIRVAERTGETQANLKLEIPRGFNAVWESNGKEELGQRLASEGYSIHLPLAPYEIRTVLIRPKIIPAADFSKQIQQVNFVGDMRIDCRVWQRCGSAAGLQGGRAFLPALNLAPAREILGIVQNKSDGTEPASLMAMKSAGQYLSWPQEWHDGGRMVLLVLADQTDRYPFQIQGRTIYKNILSWKQSDVLNSKLTSDLSVGNFSTFWIHSDGRPETYDHALIYWIEIPIEDGTREIRLPNDSRLKIVESWAIRER